MSNYYADPIVGDTLTFTTHGVQLTSIGRKRLIPDNYRAHFTTYWATIDHNLGVLVWDTHIGLFNANPKLPFAPKSQLPFLYPMGRVILNAKFAPFVMFY